MQTTKVSVLTERPPPKSPYSVTSVSSPSPKSPRVQQDRFIPTRSAVNKESALLNLYSSAKENSGLCEVSSPSKDEFKKQLAGNLFGEGDPENCRILAFKGKGPTPPEGYQNRLSVMYSNNNVGGPKVKKTARYIPQSAEKILDAPDLLDDYYLNLLDWSCKNVVAVALGQSVYLWDASTGSTEVMMTAAEGDCITSVSWCSNGGVLAVGLNSSLVQIWDSQRMQQLRNLKGHVARVGSLAWNGSILTTGGRDNMILNHDIRIRDHVTSRLPAHEQEICGLKWSPSGQQLASGGNDNLLHIWDVSSASQSGSKYLHRLDQHQAAVKALAWCPFQSNLLASGGGTADRCIKMWNTQTGVCLNSIDTKSQVCALQWSRHEKELLSSHGFSQNQLCLWKYPSMVKIAEMTGHTARVLHMAQSPDGDMVVSAAADETLRFWKVFGTNDTKFKAKVPTSSTFPSTTRGLR